MLPSCSSTHLSQPVTSHHKGSCHLQAHRGYWWGKAGKGHSPRLGLGKLSCSRKMTFSTKCWMSHCSGPRTKTIQSWVKPSVVGFFRSWARCPSSNFTWTVHWGKEKGRDLVSMEVETLTAVLCPGLGHSQYWLRVLLHASRKQIHMHHSPQHVQRGLKSWFLTSAAISLALSTSCCPLDTPWTSLRT